MLGLRGLRPGDDRGAAAVEFALVSVIFLTLVFGILQYGFYFYQLQSVAAAAHDGARLASLGFSSCGTLADTLKNEASAVPVSNVKVLFGAGPAKPGDQVQVVVSYSPTRFGFPFVPFISAGPRSETATERVETVGNVTSGCDVPLP